MKKEVKIGLVVIVAILAVVLGINFLKGKDVWGRANVYYAEYNNIDGLQKSSPVFYRGFKVGIVDKIILHPNKPELLLVSLNITNKNLRLSQYSVAKVVSSDLLGSKAIEIQISQSGKILQPGDTLIGDTERGLKDAVSQQIAPLKNKAENLMSSLDSALTIIHEVLNTESASNITLSIKRMAETIESLASATSGIDSLVQTQKDVVGQSLHNIEEITFTLSKNKKGIENTIRNLSTISDSLAASNLAEAITHMGKTLESTSIVLDGIIQGKGSLGKILTTDSLHKETQKAIEALKILAEDMKENPKRYINFSVFGGKTKGMKLSARDEKELRDLLDERKND